MIAGCFYFWRKTISRVSWQTVCSFDFNTPFSFFFFFFDKPVVNWVFLWHINLISWLGKNIFHCTNPLEEYSYHVEFGSLMTWVTLHLSLSLTWMAWNLWENNWTNNRNNTPSPKTITAAVMTTNTRAATLSDGMSTSMLFLGHYPWKELATWCLLLLL